MKKAAIILLIIGLPLLVILGAIILPKVFNPQVTPPAKVTLTIWGTQPITTMQPIIAAYTATRPYATLNYVQISMTNYLNQLTQAWSLGTGPDIFLFPVQDLQQYSPYLIPAPATTPSYTYTTIKRLGISEETQITKKDIAGPTYASVRNDFIDTVADDVSIGGQVYGLPVSVEPLVMFVNRKALSQAKIALHATDWNLFKLHVPAMTVFDNNFNIIQSGASLGTANNISHAIDILGLLILQNGGSITDPTGTIMTLQSEQTTVALQFYTAFADQNKEVYSWNTLQDDALTEFATGKVGYYIGYPSDESIIQQRTTGVDYEIKPVPQVNEFLPVNIARYDIFGVYKNAKNSIAAWNFLQFLTSQEGGTYYYNIALTTPARKDLINILLNDASKPLPQMLAGQALSARTLYHGKNADKITDVLERMIESINANEASVSAALQSAAEQIQLLLRT